MNVGLFEARKKEELTVTAEGTPSEPALKDILKSITDIAKSVKESLFHDLAYKIWGETLETRRYRDPRDQDPDYGRRLRELEGQIAEIDREQASFKMGDYHEGRGNKWEKWIMPGLVTLAVTGIISNVVQSITVAALRQEVTDLKAEVTDIKKLIEPRYRGAP